MHPQMRLIAQPRIAVPHAARNERIVIAGNDKHGAGVLRTFEYCKSPCSNVDARNAMVVENVTRDQDEVNPMLGSFLAKLLKGGKPRFADAVARTLLEPCDSQAQVKISSVEEGEHVRGSMPKGKQELQRLHGILYR
jgi:hypothetical protein